MRIGVIRRAAVAALVLGVGAQFAQAADVYVEWQPGRSPAGYGELAEQAARNYNNRVALLSQRRLNLEEHRTTFTMPTRVILTQNGVPLPVTKVSGTRGAGDSITLQFDTTGTGVFPSDYKTQLQSTFAASQSTIDTVFGPPAFTGAVKVVNYDAEIPARQAVAGGIFIPNAPNGPEIRFPVYLSATSAGINFVHTLLLAYMGTKSYPFDAFNEGFVRAATMRVARVPNTIPNSTAEEIEQTLDSLYDASAVYPWSNYPGLGAPTFIAPNLLNDPLPAGGSTGGIYLLRYKMAGTAWAKVLVQYPTFIAKFNDYYQRNVASYQTEAALSGLGQGILNLLKGSSGATIEGLPFATWVQRQSILDTSLTPGLKVVPEAFPFTATPATDDYGVFGIVLNSFKQLPNGNETLLSGTSYPIYWRNDFSRFFTTAQDDVIPVAGGYGSVVPNFLADEGSNTVYRTAVDLPFQGKNTRLYLPAGAYSTGTNPTPNNTYGTVVGYDSVTNVQIRLSWNGGSATFPVFKGAFGGSITDANFLLEQSVLVELRNASTFAVISSMVVNKGRGDFVVDFRSPGSYPTYTTTALGKIQGFSLPFEPLRPAPTQILGLAANQILMARWNAFTGGYTFYPDDGEMRQGLGYFIRPASNRSVSVASRTSEKTPLAVSLVPGWNLISNPVNETLTTSNVLVTTSTQSVSTWAEVAGSLVGGTFYRFNPDPVNPDLGTLVPATSFEAGQAYFVRALSNDGAVLVFNPTSRGRAVNSNAATIIPGTWRSKLEVTSTLGHYSVVELGQSATASYGADRDDEPLPIGPGGFQASWQNVGSMYRDVHPNRLYDTYNLRLDGLLPGVQYTLKNTALKGSTSLSIYGLGSAYMLQPGAIMSFTASSSTMYVQVANR